MTRQGIRENCVNMAGLSQHHQHNVCVCAHHVGVKDIMIGDSIYDGDIQPLGGC